MLNAVKTAHSASLIMLMVQKQAEMLSENITCPEYQRCRTSDTASQPKMPCAR